MPAPRWMRPRFSQAKPARPRAICTSTAPLVRGARVPGVAKRLAGRITLPDAKGS